MTSNSNIETVLKQMLHNELKSMELGMLLRSYATPEELDQIQYILEKCKNRQRRSNSSAAGTLLTEFFALIDANKKGIEK